MTPDATSTKCFVGKSLCGYIPPYGPSGIYIEYPVGIDFPLLGGMSVVFILLMFYPIEPDVDLLGSKSTSLVIIDDFIFTS